MRVGHESSNTSTASVAVDAVRRRHEAALRHYLRELLEEDERRVDGVLASLWSELARSARPAETFDLVNLFAQVRRRAMTVQRPVALAEAETDFGAADDDPAEMRFQLLTAKQREVLRLKLRQGFRLSDIAHIVELSESQAARLLHHALLRLAPAFGLPESDDEAGDDPKAALLALGEIKEEMATGQMRASAHDAARTLAIRRTADWVAKRMEQSRPPRRRARSKRRTRIGSIVAGVVLLVGAMWVGARLRSELDSVETDDALPSETSKKSAMPMSPTSTATPFGSTSDSPSSVSKEGRASGEELKSLGVVRETRNVNRGGARETVPVSTGVAVKHELMAAARGAASVEEGTALPPAIQAGAYEALDATPIVALKRALQGGQWPAPETASPARLRRYFSPVSRHAGEAGEGFVHQVEAAMLPWTGDEIAVRFAATARRNLSPPKARPAATLVLVVDSSASMAAPNRLPLVQESVRHLLEHLQPNDRLGIVTYASESQVLMPPVTLDRAAELRSRVQALTARGLTNGGAGLEAAFALAEQERIAGAEAPLVVLCSDGEFNMGVTSESELGALVREHAERGIKLAVFGFGRADRIDPRLEVLAASARGSSGYVNTRADAVIVWLRELGELIEPVASELALHSAGESVREIRSVVLPGETVAAFRRLQRAAGGGARAQLSYRPGEANSWRRETLAWNGAILPVVELSAEYRFHAAVERFGELLAEPRETSVADWQQLEDWAARWLDEAGGYRAELLDLIALGRALRAGES